MAWNYSRDSVKRLFKDVKNFTKSKEFRDFLNFTCSMPNIKPYNAMLVQRQRPNARYVASRSKWKSEYNRTVKEGAEPILVIRNFGPIGFVYDVADTEGKPLPNEFFNPFKTNDIFTEEGLKTIIDTMLYNEGIYYREEELPKKEGGFIHIVRNKTSISDISGGFIECKAEIVVAQNSTVTTKVATVLHELGHYLCGHLGCLTNRMPMNRESLPKNIEEFEAETVSYIVGRRLGIKSRSISYLNGYLNDNGTIPEMDIDVVLKAAGEVEQIAKGINRIDRNLVVDIGYKDVIEHSILLANNGDADSIRLLKIKAEEGSIIALQWLLQQAKEENYQGITYNYQKWLEDKIGEVGDKVNAASKVFPMMKTFASNGDAFALMLLAKCAAYKERALEWLFYEAAKDNLAALEAVKEYADKKESTDKTDKFDYWPEQEAYLWLKEQALKGNKYAIEWFISRDENGEKFKEDLLQKQFEAGNIDAIMFYANYYFNPDHYNYERATSLYKRAAEMGNAEAFAWLKEQLNQGKISILDWFLNHGAEGNVDFIFRIGVLLYEDEKYYDYKSHGLELIKFTAEKKYREALKWLYEHIFDHEELFEWLIELAERGNIHAQFTVGKLYEQGQVCLQNMDLAYRYVASATKKNNKDAFKWLLNKAELKECAKVCFIVGDCYRYGYGTVKYPKLAFIWYKASALMDYAEGKYAVGCCYRDGMGVVKDYGTAEEWLKKAAADNYPASFYALADMAHEKHQYEDYLLWMLKAANLNFGRALFHIGLLYENGFIVEKNNVKLYVENSSKELCNIETAIQYYAKAAEQGCVEAELKLGDYYKLDEPQVAFEWFSRAAERGSTKAMLAIATLPSPRDVKIKWLIKATAKENSEDSYLAMLELAKLSKDENEKLDWLNRAATQGGYKAKLEIAKMFEEGNGIDKDPSLALKYYEEVLSYSYFISYKERDEIKLKLAGFYERGTGTRIDIGKATAYYKELVSSGCEEALEWFKEQLEQGRAELFVWLQDNATYRVKTKAHKEITRHNYCLYFLEAECYEYGYCTNTNTRKALSIYNYFNKKLKANPKLENSIVSKAHKKIGEIARKGYAIAFKILEKHTVWVTDCIILAYCYENGIGTVKNIKKAYANNMRALQHATEKYSYKEKGLLEQVKPIFLRYLREMNIDFLKWVDKTLELENNVVIWLSAYGLVDANKNNWNFPLVEEDILAKVSNLTCEYEGELFYELGCLQETKQKYEEAFAWFLLTANNGYEQGRLKVAEMYHHGKGVIMDHEEALKWYKASAHNSLTAKMSFIDCCEEYYASLLKEESESDLIADLENWSEPISIVEDYKESYKESQYDVVVADVDSLGDISIVQKEEYDASQDDISVITPDRDRVTCFDCEYRIIMQKYYRNLLDNIQSSELVRAWFEKRAQAGNWEASIELADSYMEKLCVELAIEAPKEIAELYPGRLVYREDGTFFSEHYFNRHCECYQNHSRALIMQYKLLEQNALVDDSSTSIKTKYTRLQTYIKEALNLLLKVCEHTMCCNIIINNNYFRHSLLRLLSLYSIVKLPENILKDVQQILEDNFNGESRIWKECKGLRLYYGINVSESTEIGLSFLKQAAGCGSRIALKSIVDLFKAEVSKPEILNVKQIRRLLHWLKKYAKQGHLHAKEAVSYYYDQRHHKLNSWLM